MEDWQRKYIWRNLNVLIKNTICNPQLISELTMFLSEDDDALLEAKLKSDGRLAQAKLFYDISVKKSGMYTPLALALFETKQTGAFRVLLRGFMEVSVDGTFCLSEMREAVSSKMRYESAGNRNHTLFVKIDDNDVLNQTLHNCFKPTEVQITHSWWKNQKYGSEKIETFKFSNRRLFNFLELLVSKYSKVLTSLSAQTVNKEFVSRWVHACVMDSHFNLLNVAVEGGVRENVFDSKYLVMLAVTYGDAHIVELIIRQFIKKTRISLHDTIYEFKFSEMYHDPIDYSILTVAALRGCFPVMQFLLNHTLNVSYMRFLIHHCVVDTQLLTTDQLNERKRIIELVLQKYPALIESITGPEYIPLHYPNIHIDLIIHLVNLGVNVHAINENSRNILHLCPQYMTPEEYDKLIRHLSARGDSKIFLTLDELKYTPLHWAVMYLELLDSTLELFLSAKVDFNAAGHGNHVPIDLAVQYHRSERVLHSLIRVGADIHKRGECRWTVLHSAAVEGNLTALRSRGCDVNATAKCGVTALHLALSRSKTHTHKIVQELVQNGADVNALNKFNETPLFLAMKRKKKGEIENRSIELLKKAGAE